MTSSTSKRKLDLRLYLVTDSTPSILGDKDLVQVVEAAIKGGVTVVQYRDKHADTGDMIETAARLHAVTQRHNVPLLINDRLDVCMAVGAEGVHIGQDDMEVKRARKMLGPDSVIGATVSSIEEADIAIQAGADYLGIGTMFATPTKTDTKSIIGTKGTQEILAACGTGSKKTVPCVAIGSINASNVQRVLHQSASGENYLSGVAIVSAIMASKVPSEAASQLLKLISSTRETFYAATAPGHEGPREMREIVPQISSMIAAHAKSSILCHNMTNTVVQNFAANVCLATGSSPIMSLNGPEAADLAKLGGALVVNMGTVTPEILDVYLAGMRAYNASGNPILFDPVGGGATSVRKSAIKTLLVGGYFSVIKGNEGEIKAVAGASDTQQRGVDSGPSTSTEQEKLELVRDLAKRERCVVLMTGATDYISDGDRTALIANGSHWLGTITGSGCALGSTIASYVALHRQDKFLAALVGVLHYELAAERAEHRCRGPGTFIPAFLDALYLVRQEATEGMLDLSNVAVEFLDMA